jgi:hypothetical protein
MMYDKLGLHFRYQGELAFANFRDVRDDKLCGALAMTG